MKNLITNVGKCKIVTTMVWSEWWNYRQDMIRTDRNEFGVFELADDNETTLFIGSGKVKTKLLEHLKKNDYPLATRYRIDCCETEESSRAKAKHLLEAYKAVRDGKLPLYNEKTT